MKIPTVIILRGMPGSGKSTLARSWAALNPNIRVVSTDDYFTFGKYYIYDDRHERRSQQECYEKFQMAVKKGYDVIVDNPFYKKRHYKRYLEYIELHHYHLRVVEIPCADEAQALRFNERSKRKRPKWKVLGDFKEWQPHPDAEIVNTSS